MKGGSRLRDVGTIIMISDRLNAGIRARRQLDIKTETGIHVRLTWELSGQWMDGRNGKRKKYA